MPHHSSRTTALLSLFILTLAASATAQKAAQCFYPPNGKSLVPQTHDTPCNPEAKNSVCCAPEDICLSNGLCWRADINRLHRGSCTDPTFSHPACTSICTGPNEHPFGFADVLECTPYANKNWYCGVGNSSKCNTDAAFKLTDGFFADYRNQTLGGGAGAEKTVTVTATVTQKGEVKCPVAAATPVSAAVQQTASTTTQAQGLTNSAGDGQYVSSPQVAASAVTMPASAAVATAGTTTTASGNGTANGTAAATYKLGNAASPRGGLMSGVGLAGLGALGVMLAM